MGFEALTLSADSRFLTVATENALVQDGEQATLVSGSPCRLIIFDTVSGEVGAEFIYQVDPVPEPPVVSDALHVNGLVELLALEGEGSYLALERAFSEGKGSNIRLYHTGLVSREEPDDPVTLSKDLVLDFDSLNLNFTDITG